jgi:hypothetical protein
MPNQRKSSKKLRLPTIFSQTLENSGRLILRGLLRHRLKWCLLLSSAEVVKSEAQDAATCLPGTNQVSRANSTQCHPRSSPELSTRCHPTCSSAASRSRTSLPGCLERLYFRKRIRWTEAERPDILTYSPASTLGILVTVTSDIGDAAHTAVQWGTSSPLLLGSLYRSRDTF